MFTTDMICSQQIYVSSFHSSLQTACLGLVWILLFFLFSCVKNCVPSLDLTNGSPQHLNRHVLYILRLIAFHCYNT